MLTYKTKLKKALRDANTARWL